MSIEDEVLIKQGRELMNGRNMLQQLENTQAVAQQLAFMLYAEL